MNKKTYRLIFSRLRGMLVAVSETATAAGNTVSGETGWARQAARQTVLRRSLSCFALRHAAFGAMTLAGALVISTPEAHAQIVPGGAHAPSVIQTQSGIPQVNVNRPSAAGVSVNTYGQFDVQRPGAILNNSPTIVNTQQAGYINGNPNYLPGQSASIIVNQVNSNNPSQLRGYVEVAGRRAEVVIANSSGLILDGGGFINTSRAILTTGNPTYGGNGALTGFDVTAGRITVQGAGLNASNVDQVDLIARAVAANAAIYGNTLNVVAGANHVDHDTLAATPIAGSGSLPAVSIDVSQLGGMYANRIFLASNEYGVGVSNAGVLAAQAGDLTLQSNGQLVLAGKTTASGNLAATAASIQNSGSTYAQQSVTVNTSGALSNTGTLAAQQNTNISAASLSSSGTLGAGINGDGSIGHAGDLTVAASGALGATGHTAAGGNATLSGAALSLGGSQTSASGNLTLLASIGDMSLAGASVAAGGAINATARGTLTNDNGALSSAGAQTVAAGALSNQGGQIISQSTLNIGTGGALNNRQGIIQSSGNQTLGAASIDNTAGRVVMLGNGAQSVTATGALVNAPGTTATGAPGGVIGSNGALGVSAGSIANQGQFNALGDASLHAQSIDNHAGSVTAGGNLSASSTGALNNRDGTLSGTVTTVSGASVDNSSGTVEGNTLTLSSSGNLTNRGGHISQSGNAAQRIFAGGAFDNTGGSIASNATNLDVSAQSLANDAGSIQHAGSGTLAVTTTGNLSNSAGKVVTNGALDATGAAVSNQGSLSAKGDATVRAQTLDNHAGSIVAGGALVASGIGVVDNRNGTLSGAATNVSGASVDNSNGTIEGDTLALSSSGNLSNRGGRLTQYGSADQTLSAGGTLDNTGGFVATNATNLTVSSQSVTNDTGSIQHAGSGTLALASAGTLSNTGGNVVTNGALDVSGTAVSNQGSLSAKGDATVRAQSLDNHAGSVVAGGNLGANIAGALANQSGTLSGATTTVSGSSVDNSNGTIEGNTLALSSSGNLSNRGGRLTQYGSADQTLSAGGALDNTGGTLATNAANLTVSGQSITNDAGSIQHAGTGTLNVTTPGALSDVAGQIATNGALIARSASLDNSNGTVSAQGSAQVDANTSLTNRGGTLYGKAGLTATTQGAFDNTQGSVQTDGNLSVNAGGALSNTSGTISVNGASGNAATATVSASSIDNTSGKLTNSGSGATTITAATGITNSAGTMGGNGDVTLGAQTLTNTASAKFVAARVASLNVTNRVNNSGGTIYGGTALNLNQSGASVINDSGRLEGGQDVSVRVASLANSAGALRANRDITASGVVSGDGTMTAGRNLGLAVTGDYTNGASNSLHADGNMTVSATGTLTNAGTLAASGALSASGANVVNAAGADINSASTTVNATGTLTNAGRIEGDSVTTHSATLANTGTLIGNTVQVNAADVQNTGAAAAIAAAQSLNIYASNSVTNSDGALIYSGGSLAIAKDGARDGSGMLANQTGTLTNSAATIEAVGDVDIAAHTVNNLRTGVQTQAGTPQNTGTNTLTLWTAGLSGDDLGFYDSSVYPQWNWRGGAIGTATIGALMHPITVTVPKSQVASLDANAQTLSFAQPLTDTYISTSTPLVEVCNTHDFCSQQHVSQTRTITNNATQYYNSITDNGSTYTITLWPDYNPATNIRPDNVTVRTDLGSDNHDYVEMKRVSTSTTSTDQLLSAGTPALLQAQGSIRINSDGGAINNQSSTMTAGGNLIRRAVGGSVNDSGTVLQQTVTADTQSTYYWHQKTGGSDDTKIVEDGITQSTTTVAALPAIATANGAVQTSGQTISVASVNRVGQTVVGSGVTGGNATGTQLGGVNGQAADAGTAGGVTGQTASANIATGVSGLTVRPQTLGGAAGGIPNLKLPVNSLYTYQTAPGATYLVATDPRLTTYTKFISSDYLLGALGLNPQTTEKRLGDGAYEQQLVMNQVTQLTGRTFLAGYSDNLDEYTALMNSGVTYAKSFGLTPGIGLTDAQMKQLTTDLVWLVSQTVTLPDGTQQTVLVPKLYLAQANTVDLQDSGALVAGNAVSLNATGDVSNSGHIVGDMATAVLGNNIVNSGVIGSGGTTVVSAVQDVRNTSGRIGGVQTVVQAGRDVINETATASVSNTLQQAGFTSSASSQNILATGTISASENAVVLAQRDVNLAGAAIESGNSAFVGAGRNINVGTTTLGATQDAGTNDGLNGGHTTTTQNVGSMITTGGNLTTVSGGNTTLTNATVRTGGDAAMIAANNLTLTAATDTRSHKEQSLGGPQSKHTGSSYDETAQGSNLNAARDLTLGAGQTAAAAALLKEHGLVAAADAPIGAGNLTVLGSSATTGASAADGSVSGGAATLAATGNVTIGAVTETHDSQSWSHNEHSGFMSSDKTTDQTSSHQVISVGSTVSGDTVSANAGHDLTIAGSTVASTNDMSLSAGHDLTVTTTQDTSQSSRFHQEQKSGLGGTGGAGISYGTSDRKETTTDNSVTQNGSLVGSTDGSVTMTAGNGLHITGSDVIAARDVTGKAASVTIDAATGTNHHDETQETKTSGFTLGLGGSVGDAINNAIQQSQAAGSGAGDSRAKALHGIAAAGNAAMAVAGVTGGSLAGSNPSISVQLSYGTSQSKNTFTEDQTMQTGSTIKAGGTASFTATGGGDGPASPNNGNVTIAGSSVSGNNVALSAQNEVNLINTTNTDSTRSTNRSSSASVGVSYGTNGFGVSASMSNAHGDANSDAAMQNNTHVSAANNVSIVSGGNTSIVGADVSGNHVSADVGGNLNVQSVQDTTVSAAHQSSTSGGFSISQGGGNASFSSQHGSSSGNYAAVNGQAGIQAGNGGFDINVKGNTNLTGAYIASTADASKNGLTTGTLTVSDIQNHSDYSASSGGFSAGAGIGSTGKAVGPGSVSGAGGVTPMMSQHDSGSSSATTKSAISAGTISVTDAANQAQDVAGINRDTTDLNGRVSKLPDVNNLLSAQADTMNAAQAAGQVVAQGIGAYADMKRDQASDEATAASWDEGGTDRTLLHIAGGALIGGLGGGGIGTALQGAAGAGLSAAMAKQLEDIYKGVGSATGSELLGNIAANVVAGVGGALVGGGVGASTASNVELYNQAAHRKPKDLVSQVCPAGAQCSDATLNAVIQAQGDNAAVASGNMKTAAAYGAPAAAVIALGPEAVTAAALAGGLDYTGGVYSYATGLTKDAPSVTNSYIAGVVGGLAYPLAIGDAAIAGMGTAGKIAANAYNAGVTGVGAFGTAAMTGGNPDISAGFATGSVATGSLVKAMFPGPIGNFLNNLIQGAAGPIQNAVTQGGSNK
ncbi:hypothetical protein DR64_540 [Paraburkholderia xenovorans LB400]|uniref:Polymorphic membrane protein, Filamentous haemagglutinin/Adhesin n=1 Tax=Paraburkholderia xenovorans (strain LB400) TaxID=266265 RepID=Q140X4_PARXL|nr:hemagglutinin repeat-containing protein [Paraburkholderia xenovorans]ABE30115.1 Polymorphic membrane protein, Filamentous haemagglutinin/Adhesin [Paraburkholderia xenovorans LB400]AIP31208.1 hypothetical protein DR64_540 [Paraburkholderia xenovorans LB400]